MRRIPHVAVVVVIVPSIIPRHIRIRVFETGGANCNIPIRIRIEAVGLDDSSRRSAAGAIRKVERVGGNGRVGPPHVRPVGHAPKPLTRLRGSIRRVPVRRRPSKPRHVRRSIRRVPIRVRRRRRPPMRGITTAPHPRHIPMAPVREQRRALVAKHGSILLPSLPGASRDGNTTFAPAPGGEEGGAGSVVVVRRNSRHDSVGDGDVVHAHSDPVFAAGVH
mmetsp:Transcript_2300/g.4525  ORF Transcript_2300/g.4525 Transcript_2300/m.4525 type:complete len:220 (+) Transcript_2300:1326-1985(+)